MGRVLLVLRLAVRDVRRRPVEAALLFVAIAAATTTLSLGLVLREAAGDPYLDTRSVTSGPDVVASVTPSTSGERADVDELAALADASGVVGHSGPYPVSTATLTANGRSVDVQAEGRDTATADVDQPELVEGSWVATGEVVVEAALADALDVGTGDRLTLEGEAYRVAGVAVTAATLPYPEATDYSMTPLSQEQRRATSQIDRRPHRGSATTCPRPVPSRSRGSRRTDASTAYRADRRAPGW